MVAVFTGNALGLFDTSLSQVGGGLSGGAGRDQQGVNVKTGNLVLQGIDELLTFRGMTLSANRTYNSRGVAVDASDPGRGVGADGWRTGFESTVKVIGTLNQAGSVLRLYAGDGGVVDFAWTGTANEYASTAGDGAHDRMSWTGTYWIRDEGSTRRQEYYEGIVSGQPAAGRLKKIFETRTDGTDPAQTLVVYDASGRIIELRDVRNADGDNNNEALIYTYNSDGQINAIYTRENGVQRLQTTYFYDTLGRLEYVYHDLTVGTTTDNTWDPDIAANNDGELHRTQYTYDGSTLRIASVRSSDGQLSSYTYWVGGTNDGKIKTVTRGDTNTNDADGVGETTTFTYDTVAGRTDVVDGQNRMWSYYYDTLGQLTKVESPARDGLRDVTTYEYGQDIDGNVEGNVTKIETTRGTALVSRKEYSYSGNGNMLSEWDALGNTIQRTWTTANQLATQTVFTGPDPDGKAGAGAPTGGQTTQFVYDAQNRLRFSVGPTGEVTEMRYATTGNATGQLTETRRYFVAYSGTYDLTALGNWVLDKASQGSLTALQYDLAGRVSLKTEYASESGVSTAMSITEYVYSAQGQLLKQVTRHGSTHTAGATAESEIVDYVYDGIGRLLDVVTRGSSVTYAPGQDVLALTDATTLVSKTRYIDSTMQVSIVSDGGVTRLETRNAAGHVLQVSEAATGMTTRDTEHYYDKAGQLVASQDDKGGRTYFFYDERGNVAATVDPTGSLVETEYDSLGRVIRTLEYAVRVTTTGWLDTTKIGTERVKIPALSTVRPGWSEDFDSDTLPQFNTTDLSDPTKIALTRDGVTDRLVLLRSNQGTTTTYPHLYANTNTAMSAGALYRAEVSTDASVSNLYGFIGLNNTGTGGATKQVGFYFGSGTLNAYIEGTNTLLSTLTANTTYIVELHATADGIDLRVYVKGQDASNGFEVHHDADPAFWQQHYLNIQAQMGQGSGYAGVPLYVDNISQQLVRQASRDYDTAGRLVREFDGSASTTYEYDGAHRLVRTTVATAGEADRVTRQFYNASGWLMGTLDAEGFLTAHSYDGGGRVVRSTRYATVTPSALRASADLATLQAQTPTHLNDQVTRYFYDRRNRQIGVLDAGGYLTETIYDEAGNERVVRAYAKQLAAGGVLAFTDLRTAALTTPPTEPYRDTRRVFNGLGQVDLEVNHEGTVTKFSYDHAGRLTRTEVAQGTTEVREHNQWFDAFGQLIGEIDPANVAAATAVKSFAAMTDAEKTTAFTTYGVRHIYDVLGRRIESIDPYTNRTWYFYDAAGRQTFVARGRMTGAVLNDTLEITETRYSAFGQVIETLTYAGTPTNGTKNAAGAAAVIAAANYANAAVDNRRQYLYDTRGLLIQETDAESGVSVMRYNGFGELASRTVAYGTNAAGTTTRTYDRRGLATTQVEGSGSAVARTISTVYDAFGRAVTTTDGRGFTTTAGWDKLGRLVSTSRATYGGTGVARTEGSSTLFDAYSRTLSHTDGRGYTTTYTYSDTARTMTVTPAEGPAVTTYYDRHGQVESIEGPGTSTTDYDYDAAGRLLQETNAVGDFTTYQYDKRGLRTRSLDGNGLGNQVDFTYDAAGRMLTRKEDTLSGGQNLLSTWTWDAMGRQVTATDAEGVVIKTEYDRNGRAVKITSDFGTGRLNIITLYEWDDAGQQVSVTEGDGSTVERKTLYTYDALGRRISEVVDQGTGKLNLTTSYAYDAADNVIARTDAAGNITRFAYDEAGRLVFTLTPLTAVGTASPQFAVSRNYYDEAGNVTATRRYAAKLTLTSTEVATLAGASGTAANVLLDTKAAALTNAATDGTEYFVYDKAGRLRYHLTQIDAGNVYATETRYNGQGAAFHTLDYLAPIGVVAAWQGYLLMEDDVAMAVSDSRFTAVAGWMPTGAGVARETVHVINGAGRERFVLTRLDATTAYAVEKKYNDTGGVIEQIVHHTPVPFDPAATVATLNTALGPFGESERTRTHFAYDPMGRLRFSVDDAGAVTEQVYDGAGRVEQVRQYMTPVTPVTYSEANIAAAVSGQAGVRTTTHLYDGAGRLVKTTDALGKFEQFGYDAVGNRISYTDKLTSTWNYEYDAAGRLTCELSPTVTVWRNSSLTGVSVASESLRIATRMTYDARGNVLTRTENADAVDANERRTTTYEYDARGLQIKTTFPDAWKVDELTGTLVAIGGTLPNVQVGYDALGRAVTQKDTLGNYSYKVYDILGRATHAVDAAGYVTVYSYDGAGNQTSLTRFAKALDKPALQALGWAEGQPIGADKIATAGVIDADTINDRKLTTTYDLMGRKSQVWQSAILHWGKNSTSATVQPTTKFLYDAVGQVILESVLLESVAGSPAEWAVTWHYYDDRGQRTMTVDAQGYVTSFAYDAAGAEVARIEFARAIDTASLVPGGTPPALPAAGDLSTGYDRSVVTAYDAIGRKTSETRPRVFQTSTGVGGVRQVVTGYEYDAEDRLTAVVEDGARTTTSYDVLGRASSVIEPERLVLRSDWQTQLADAAVDLSSAALYQAASPYSVMCYDAFGNALLVAKYANGRVGGTTVADSANDQYTYTRYDRQGRAVITRDGAGRYVYSAFDAADRMVRTWSDLTDGMGGTSHIVGQYTHDALGQQTSATTTRTLAGVTSTDAREAARYNAFGEITAKAATTADLAIAANAIEYTYDKAGNQIQDDAEGGIRVFGYDLAGRQVRETRHWLDSEAVGSPTVVTRFTLDLLGRQIARIQPSHTSALGPTSTVRLKLDRWGNVLQQVDPRGYVTDWTYNDRDQAIRQLAPEVQVVSATGVTTWDRPETRWSYDAGGRLIAVRDPNGNVDRITYDVAGHVAANIDALGNATRSAYDALGRMRVREDATGYLTTQAFDKADHLTAIGDFLVDGTGATRVQDDRETYLLDGRGDRIRTTNALGQYARQNFDSRGLLIRSQSATGQVTTYEYDATGNKVKETNGLGGEQTWVYDIHGRVVSHRDLDGNDYTYTYGKNGRLASETSTDLGLARTYAYNPNGAVRQIKLSASDYSEYEYDEAGNRTLDRTVNTAAGINTVTRVVHDSHGRVARVTTDDLTRALGVQRTLDLEYSYDAVGNRRRVVANSGYGPGVDPLSTANLAPQASNPSNVTLKFGQAVEWRLRPNDYFRDPDGNAMTYAIQGTLPSWLSFSQDAATGEWVFAYTGTGTAGTNANITIQANGGGATATVVFNAAIVTNSTPGLLTASTLVVDHKSSLPVLLDFWAPDLFTDSDVGDALGLGVTGTLPAGFTADTSVFGRVRLTAAAGLAAGDYTLTLRAVDNGGLTRSKTVTVRVKAATGPAIVTQPPPQSIQPGRDFDLQFNVDTLFADQNGDPFSLDAWATNGDELPSWIDFAVLSDGNRRYVRLLGSTPSSMTAGQTFVVRLRATDTDGMAGFMDVTLTTKLPPAVPVGSLLSAVVGRPYSGQLIDYSDPAGGTLTYSASGLPAGLSLSTTGLLSGTPMTKDSYAVTVTVTSSASGLVTSKALTLRVYNNKPVAGTIANQSAIAGQAWSLNVSTSITDSDQHTLIWSTEALPAGISFSSSTKTFSGSPTTAGTYTITVSASDGYDVVSTSFTLTVATAFVPTVVNPIVDKNTFANESWSYTFPATTFNGTPTSYTHSFSSTPSTGTVVSFNSSTRTFSIASTPQVSNGVAITITVTANYSGGLSVSDTFVLDVDQDERLGGGGGMMMSEGGDLEASMEASLEQASQIDAELAQSAYVAQTVQTMIVPVPGGNRQESWYLYDAENRVSLANGVLDGGQVVMSSLSTYRPTSYVQQYDEMGRATVQLFDTADGLKTDRTEYTQRGERWRTYTQYAGGQVVPRSIDTYDAAGRLTRSVSLFAPGAKGQYYTTEASELIWWEVDLGGAISSVVDYVYDADGRLRTQTTSGRRANQGPSGFNPNTPDYDPNVETAASWLAAQFPIGGRSLASREYTYNPADTTLTKLDEVLYTTEAGTVGVRTDDASAYDAAGRLLSYRYVKSAAAWSPSQTYTAEVTQLWTHTYTYAYLARDGYLEQGVTGTSNNINYRTSSTTSTYDAAGRRTEIVDWRDVPGPDNNLQAKRELAYNGDGQILLQRRFYNDAGDWEQGADEGSGYNLANKFKNTITDTAWNALSDTDRANWYDDADNTRATYVNGNQVVSHTEAGTEFNANGGLTGFSNTTMGRTQVQVQQGDNLKSLAQRIYGNENLWYVLADANGLTSDSPLSAGTTLTAPEVKTTSNDAGTFKPYDPSEITGSTTPNMAYMPPPDAGCGTVGMIIMVIVIVIVTIYTAGAAAAAVSQMAAGAVAGTAGAAAAGFSATMTAGLSALAGGAGSALGFGAAVAGAAVGGAVGNLAGQVAGNMMGIVDGLNFKDVAVSGMTSALGAVVGGGLAKTNMFSVGNGAVSASADAAPKLNVLGKTVAGVAGYTAGAASRKVVGQGSNFSWRGVAAAALGSAVSATLGGKASLVSGTGEVGDSFFDNLQDSLINGAANAGSRELFGVGDIDWRAEAIDAFGNAIANTIVGVGMHLSDEAAARRRALRESTTQGQKRLLSELQGEANASIDARLGADFELRLARADARISNNLERKISDRATESEIADRGKIAAIATTFGNELKVPQTRTSGSPSILACPVDDQIFSGATWRPKVTPLFDMLNGLDGGRLPPPPRGGNADAPAPIETVPTPLIPSAPDKNAWKQDVSTGLSVGTGVLSWAEFGMKTPYTLTYGINQPYGSMWTEFVRYGGKVPTELVGPTFALSLTPGLRELAPGQVRIDLRPHVGGVRTFGIYAGGATLAYEAVTMDHASAWDWGHLAASGGAYYYGTWGGLPGLAAATVYTVADIGVQNYDYTIKYGKKAGTEVSGWRALSEVDVDQREESIRAHTVNWNLDRNEAELLEARLRYLDPH